MDEAFSLKEGEWKIRVYGRVLPHSFNSKGAAEAGIVVEKKRVAQQVQIQTADEQQYQRGAEYAEWWIGAGGKLLVEDLPPGWSEARCNGFSDRLKEERDKMAI